MRQILFRGKRLDNGEWVEGCYILDRNKAYIWQSFGMRFYEVDPSTVGEWAGVTDKNGKIVFEGDIVVGPWIYKPGEVVKFSGGGFSPYAIPGWECTPDEYKTEVVGNIYDNPEILTK